jgi:hypothetical protein
VDFESYAVLVCFLMWVEYAVVGFGRVGYKVVGVEASDEAV